MFEKAVTNGVNTNLQTQMTGSLGVIVSYDEIDNTASVAITENDTDEIREILTSVPCPVTYGVQGVAPQAGKLCYVLFKNGNIQSPLIVGIYNHRYNQFDSQRQSRTVYSLPSHLMD